MVIVPEPPPLTVTPSEADMVEPIVISELPVPLVIVAAPEATVIAVTFTPSVLPRDIFTVPLAERIPRL
jgi:hypothetical protein